MQLILPLVFVILAAGLVLSAVRTGRYRKTFYFFRWLVSILCTALFMYWFAEDHLRRFDKNAIKLQISNRLPTTVDFYLQRATFKNDGSWLVNTEHLGKIRPEYFRENYLKRQDSNNFWLIGYLGQKDLVYFNRFEISGTEKSHSVEITSYSNTDIRLSEIAEKETARFALSRTRIAIWSALSLLLLMLNWMLLLRRRKKSSLATI